MAIIDIKNNTEITKLQTFCLYFIAYLLIDVAYAASSAMT